MDFFVEDARSSLLNLHQSIIELIKLRNQGIVIWK